MADWNVPAERVRRLLISALALLLIGACARAAPAPPPAAPPAEPPPPQLPEVVWTARPEVALRLDSTAVALPYLFTRLDVQGRESPGHLRVTCPGCEPPLSGTVAEEDVVWEAAAPVEAAIGSAAEFALALRDAAAWRRVDSLTAVMVSDFTFGLSAQRDRGVALTAWSWENFRNVDQVPLLLDAGLVEIDKDFWVAPPRYADGPQYTGLRLGFRRNAESGRWEWLFLVRGEGGE